MPTSGFPSPSTGRTLIQINGQRAIYNSGAIGLGTASLGMIFVGLFGFYVISNAIRRDIVSRCGLVAASTPMRSGEYLLGKFLGNLVFLTIFLAGFMLSSMAMLLVRGEARIEPVVFRGAISPAHARGDRFCLRGRGPLRIDPVARRQTRRRRLFLLLDGGASGSRSATRRAKAGSTGRAISILPASVS